jgi:hypothetical protein
MWQSLTRDDAEKIQRCPADDHALEAQVPVSQVMVESIKTSRGSVGISITDTCGKCKRASTMVRLNHGRDLDAFGHSTNGPERSSRGPSVREDLFRS